MVQGGDPTGTGTGGDSVYGETFIDEFHQRLNFSHRGIVAMANDGERNQNGSQFFMTTAPSCDWLEKKHTIFGKIAGETIFNLIKLSEVEIDGETDRPICDPIPMIEKALVLDSGPFDDIVPRQIVRPDIVTKVEEAPKKKTFKAAIRNNNLISFADEDDEEEEAGVSTISFKRKGIRAQHEAEGNKSKPAKKVISEE